MAQIDDLYDEFVRAWHDGLAPDAATFLERAPSEDRDDLAAMIGTFVLVAPSVTPIPARAGEIAEDPVFLRALALVDDPPRPWGARLTAARQRAGLTVAELGDRFAASFGLEGRAERASRLLAELERGDLDAAGVSRGAGRRLSEILGVALDALTPPRAPSALFRAEDEAQEAYGELLAGAAVALGHPADEPWDELDDLLRGGDRTEPSAGG